MVSLSKIFSLQSGKGAKAPSDAAIQGVPVSAAEKLATSAFISGDDQSFKSITPASFAQPNERDRAVQAFAHYRARAPDLFESGVVGVVDAARLIGKGRTDGDFRFTYGRETFESFLEADALLRSIPKGKLADQLDLSLLADVNRLVAAADSKNWREISREALVADLGDLGDLGKDLWERTLWLAANVRRGNSPRPGVMRQDSIVTRVYGPFDDAAIENARSLGIDFRETARSKPNERTGRFVYVQPEDVEAALKQLVSDTVSALRTPEMNAVEVAADFARRFAALHPFEEWNGRTGRLIMDRILAEADLPPAILADPSTDIVLSKEDYAKQVAEGIQRTTRLITRSKSSSTRGWVDYAKSLVTHAGKKSDALTDLQAERTTVMIGGQPFALGSTGFLYDAAGRAYEVSHREELRPLSQLEMYLTTRRLAQTEDPKDAFTGYTHWTRQFAGRVSRTPLLGEQTMRVSDEAVLAADNAYRLELPARGNERFVALFDLRALPDELAFGKAPSLAVSRYQQLDLEMWHVARELKRNGDKQGARAIFAHREALFDKAKAYLRTLASAEHISPENPNGFTTRYEELAWEKSPLFFDSLRQAIKARGDDRMRVWRGDAITAELLGVQVDNIPFRDDAMELAERREANGSTHNLIRDLLSVAGMSKGSAFQCYTTDLALLSKQGGFAEKANSFALVLSKLPGPVRAAIERVVEDGETVDVYSVASLFEEVFNARQPTSSEFISIEGHDRESFLMTLESVVRDETQKQTLVERFEEAVGQQDSVFARLVSNFSSADIKLRVDDVIQAEAARVRLQTSLNDKRATLSVTREGDTLKVKVFRRAYLLERPKAVAMPGPWTLGGTFHAEQEVTGLQNVSRSAILDEHPADVLRRALPKHTGSPEQRLR